MAQRELRPPKNAGYFLKLAYEDVLMKICSKCVLPETFPGISFNDEGVCNYCLKSLALSDPGKLAEQKEKYRLKFESLLDKLRDSGDYDCLMCYSGGKDSTYTLYILREEYNARILAVTVDNGFVSERAVKNIQNVAESIGFDHYFIKPRFDILKRIFVACSSKNLYSRKTLERASTICTSCMGFVKFISLRMAIEKSIPFITYGWSPGQAPIASSVFKTNPSMIRSMQEAIKGPMSGIVGDEINPYFLEERHFSDPGKFPYNISPLAFLEYNEEKIFEKIGELGWKAPEDTDANSTNCLLNSYANELHIKQFGYHPYAFEIANLVRENLIDREDALERFTKDEDFTVVECVKEKLFRFPIVRSST
jgi:hypothetical protein